MATWLLLGLLWPGPAERDQAIRRLQADEQYQRVLPGVDAGVEPAPAPPSRPPRGERTRTEGVVGTLLWVVIGLTGVALLIIVGREVATRPSRARVRAAEPAAVPVLHLESATLDEAERLAAQGRYGEAIHALLMRTFAAIQRQVPLPDALTSREILGRVVLQPEAHAALTHLVQAVEVSHFGTAEPGADDYTRCRAGYERVTAARGVQVA